MWIPVFSCYSLIVVRGSDFSLVKDMEGKNNYHPLPCSFCLDLNEVAQKWFFGGVGFPPTGSGQEPTESGDPHPQQNIGNTI